MSVVNSATKMTYTCTYDNYRHGDLISTLPPQAGLPEVFPLQSSFIMYGSFDWSLPCVSIFRAHETVWEEWEEVHEPAKHTWAHQLPAPLLSNTIQPLARDQHTHTDTHTHTHTQGIQKYIFIMTKLNYSLGEIAFNLLKKGLKIGIHTQ